MKKLILLELALLFLATTFSSNPPPGWYQQQLPVNDFINDIFFLDSLNGWVVTQGSSSDTSYFLKTMNGGNNWIIQQKEMYNPYAIQLIDSNLGYTVGTASGLRKIYKTTNGGINWIELNVLNLVGILNDLSFVNKDTGWVTSIDPFDGGLFKTTDGGVSWQRQLNETYKPSKVFFINKDTGWINSNTDKIYKTTTGGNNWFLQVTFGTQLYDIFFKNKDTGYVSANRIYKTTNGGINWIPSQSSETGQKLSFVSDSIGWASQIGFIITKTTTAGTTWFNQQTPIFNNLSVSASDSLRAWAGGNGIVHTTDGGGATAISNQGNSIPQKFTLNQNYPNPFNPVTVISYQLSVSSYVQLKVFDITGKHTADIVNAKQSEGEYKINFDGSGLNSGVYFYKLEVYEAKTNHTYSETKKMVLIR